MKNMLKSKLSSLHLELDSNGGIIPNSWLPEVKIILAVLELCKTFLSGIWLEIVTIIENAINAAK
jgi:hypothetical protein